MKAGEETEKRGMQGNAEYYLIRALEDYKLARGFVREQEVEDHPLSFPTVVAIDEAGDILGILSTDSSQDMVIAGPLVIRKGIRGHRIVVGLVDAYDKVMRSLGIQSYVHSVDKENKAWLRMIEKAYGTEPYAEKDGRLFFIKRLNGEPDGQHG